MKGNHPDRMVEKKRNSSIELYRIIATFAVLIVHFNGWFVGGMPERFNFTNPTSFRIGQMIIEAATCICINMFLIISGYFGISLRLKSLLRICCLLFFIYMPCYLVRAFLFKDIGFSIPHVIGRFFVISNAGYFIQCYLMLMFLSPILNSFIEKNGKKILFWCLAFWVVEIWFGCIMNVEELGFNHGYSVIHFVLMYMLARCLFLFKEDLRNINVRFWIIGYLGCTLIICFMYLVGIQFCWDYSNPVVVVSSICSFMPFIYKYYENHYINWIAKSTLTVYVLQVTKPFYTYLIRIDNHILCENSYSLYLILSVIVISIFFIFGVLYGQLCDQISKPFINKVCIWLESRNK